MSAGGGGGPGPGGRPLTSEQAFVIAVCANDQDLSSDCLNADAMRATKRLTTMYLTAYAKSAVKSYVLQAFRVVFPNTMAQADQQKALLKIEERAIAYVRKTLEHDVAKLTPFRWPTAAEQQQNAEVVRTTTQQVQQWNKDAKTEVYRGSNWTHDWSSSTHTFHTGEAYRQLQSINISGWGGT